MRRLLRVALLCGLVLQRPDTTSATVSVLHAFDGSDGVSPRDLDLADLVAMHSLGSRADRRARRDDPLFFSLDRDAERDHVTARVGGRGRARSDGITITRAIHRRDGKHEQDESKTDPGMVSFSPPQLDVGWVESCSPTLHTIYAESHSPRTLRIDDVRFESDAFLLASDPRGVVLAPGESVKINVLFVVGEPQPFESFVFLVTSLGEFALPVRGHTKPSLHGLSGLRVTVPVGARVDHTIHLRNPSADSLLRVSEIFSLDGVGNVQYSDRHVHSTVRLPSMFGDGPRRNPIVGNAWELPPHSTKPVARFTFHANGDVGRYKSAVRVATSTAQFLVPIEITVHENQFIVEPTEVDLGVFASDREQRHVLLTFHNTGSQPVMIREIRLGKWDGLDQSADILPPGEMPVIPPLSRVQHAVQLVLQDGKAYRPGRRNMQIEINTNDSSTMTHRVDVRGFAMRGHLSYSLAQTTFRVVAPSKSEHANTTEKALGVVELGDTVSRVLALTNEFDDVLDLERVAFPSSCRDFDVDIFRAGIASPSAAFPEIRLSVRPHAEWPVATRVCSLQVETNASVHYVPIVLYSGLLRSTSSRNVSEQTLSLNSCDSEAPPNAEMPTEGDQVPHPRRSTKFCRRVILEMGKVATRIALDDVFNLTNVNPIDVPLRIHMKKMRPKNVDEPLGVETVMTTHADPHVPLEIAILGTAWERTRRDDQANASNYSGRSLAPGRTLSLRLHLKIQTDHLGVFFEPVATIETEFETIQFFVRFETTQGTITPDLVVFEVPNTHPGRIGHFDIPFTSTMDHDVVSRGLELSSSTDGRAVSSPFGVWRAPTVFLSNATTTIRVFYFPPAFYADCRRGRFYADCFLVNRSLHSALGTALSGYGSFVTKRDIARLSLREREWRRQDTVQGGGDRIDVVATLSTDAVRTLPVRLTAYLTRPQFFHSGGSDQTVAFPLTEILQQFVAHITITNPSDYAMEVELAIAEEDRDLFYACDDDLNEDECLREWQDIASDRVVVTKHPQHQGHRNDAVVVAPLFFKPRVIRVVGRDQIRVGPIYFFPSSVGAWRTRVYVRNVLTHIEAITVTASSGMGELSVGLLQPETNRKQAAVPVHNHTIRFVVDHHPGSHEPTQRFESTQILQLRNSGSYQLRCSARLTPGETANAFRMTPDWGVILTYTNGNQILDELVLVPEDTLSLAVEFTPDCFNRHASSEIDVVTRDGTTRYFLIGTMTPRAAFQCRRQLFSAGVLKLFRQLWVVAASVAGLTVIMALRQVTRGRAARRGPRVKPKANDEAKSSGCIEGTTGVAVAARGETDMAALVQALCRLEDTAPSSTAIVVLPHVAALLESRRTRKKGRRPQSGVSHRVAAASLIGSHDPATQREPASLLDNMPSGPISTKEDCEAAPVVESLLVPDGNQEQHEGDEDCGLVKVHIPAAAGRMIENKQEYTGEPALREDTASEEDGEEDDDDESEPTDNQVDGDGTITFGTPEEGDKHKGDGKEGEEEGELLVLNSNDPFVSLSDFRLEEPRPSRSFEDDWSALSFELLQNEIGKLVADDRPTMEPASPPAFSHSRIAERNPIELVHDHPVGGALTALSMAPPLLPMSSLFGSSSNGPPPPLPPLPLARQPQGTRAAPPGFTSADANPTASRQAFQRFQHHQPAPAPADSPVAPASPSLLHGFLGLGQGTTTTTRAAFSAPYSLFGPALGSASLASELSVARDAMSAGRIGSRLSGGSLSDTLFDPGHHPSARAPAASTSRLVALDHEKLPVAATTSSSPVRMLRPPSS